MPGKRAEIVAELQTDILRLQGFKSSRSNGRDMGLGAISNAFPNGTFPIGAIHEFLSANREDAAATCGFIAGLLSPLMSSNGASLWISTARTIFPPALKSFGIEPDRVIFVDLQKEKDVLWAVEEGLKCPALTAVVGEMKDLDFTASRRLQLAVEESQVTGFIVRHNTRKLNTTACVSRWNITSLASDPVDNLPGVGFPQWNVALLKIRNGRPGVWAVRWANGKFEPVENASSAKDQRGVQVSESTSLSKAG